MSRKLKQLADKFAGKCLSRKFVNKKTKYKWKCAQGHIFLATYSDVSRNRWCPECYRAKRYKTIDYLHSLAKVKGGMCLSTIYINNRTKYLFKCNKNHVFSVRPTDISSKDYWCPICSKGNRRSKVEKEIFKYVKSLDNTAVPNQIGLLKSKKMELDIFIPRLMLGIEVDGVYFHSLPHNVKRDKIKNKQCKEAGIKLVRVKDTDFYKDKSKVFSKLKRLINV